MASHIIKPYCQERKQQGLIGEEIVKEILENYYTETLYKTEKINDTLDFFTGERYVEVKRRLAPYCSTDKYFEEGALLPFCKFVRALEENKPVFFYYYFDADQTLWELEFNPDFLVLFKPFVPRGSSTRQPHITIPKKYWKQIHYVSPA